MNDGTAQRADNDRRAFPRYDVMAYARQKPDSTNRFYFVKDLSEAGAFLVTKNAPDVGVRLKLNISIRFLQKEIRTDARVVRCEEKGFGVTFVDMSIEDLLSLRNYLYREDREKILSKFNKSHLVNGFGSETLNEFTSN